MYVHVHVCPHVCVESALTVRALVAVKFPGFPSPRASFGGFLDMQGTIIFRIHIDIGVGVI